MAIHHAKYVDNNLTGHCCSEKRIYADDSVEVVKEILTKKHDVAIKCRTTKDRGDC